jgi:hypothetical protein
MVRREAFAQRRSRERDPARLGRNEVKAPEPLRAGGERGLSLRTEKRIDREARKLSAGDLALWLHYRTLLLGERKICRRGKKHWISYLLTKRLKQYPAVEKSVIGGWRRFIKHTTRIPSRKQADNYAKNCWIVLDGLRRKPRSQHAEILKHRAGTFRAAAMRGDTDFFRAVGRLLSRAGRSGYLKRFEYAEAMLSRWLTDYYWLMPAKLASYLLSIGLDVGDNLRSFLASKSRYGLKSHRPTLIQHFDSSPHDKKLPHRTEDIVPTKLGKKLLAAARKARKQ